MKIIWKNGNKGWAIIGYAYTQEKAEKIANNCKSLVGRKVETRITDK